MQTDVMDELARYLAIRDQQRLDHANAFLATLTAQERRLVEQGASHGYAVGWTYGAEHPDVLRKDDYPHDDDILQAAIASMREPIDLETLWNSNQRYYWLFREAAVMGHVIGDRHGGVDARDGRPCTLPSIEQVTILIVEHCQSTSDLYPIIGGSSSSLLWNLLRRNGRTSRVFSRAKYAEAVIYLMPQVTADRVDSDIDDLLDDGRIVETPDGIVLGEQS